MNWQYSGLIGLILGLIPFFFQELIKFKFGINYYKANQLLDRRVRIIEELYEKLVNLDSFMKAMTDLIKFESKDINENERIEVEKIINAINGHNDFIKFYKKHKLYFAPKTCELIEKIDVKYSDSYRYYNYGEKYKIEDYETAFKFSKAASDTIRKEIPPILENIEKEFRKIIGVTNKKSK